MAAAVAVVRATSDEVDDEIALMVADDADANESDVSIEEDDADDAIVLNRVARSAHENGGRQRERGHGRREKQNKRNYPFWTISPLKILCLIF